MEADNFEKVQEATILGIQLISEEVVKWNQREEIDDDPLFEVVFEALAE